jgi:hypothetical protein
MSFDRKPPPTTSAGRAANIRHPLVGNATSWERLSCSESVSWCTLSRLCPLRMDYSRLERTRDPSLQFNRCRLTRQPDYPPALGRNSKQTGCKLRCFVSCCRKYFRDHQTDDASNLRSVHKFQFPEAVRQTVSFS